MFIHNIYTLIPPHKSRFYGQGHLLRKYPHHSLPIRSRVGLRPLTLAFRGDVARHTSAWTAVVWPPCQENPTAPAARGLRAS